MTIPDPGDETVRKAESAASESIRSRKDRDVRRIDFHELSGGLDVVLITCGDEVYQLKQTRFGKLLLNK
jgi:hemin uptake protein HemP